MAGKYKKMKYFRITVYFSRDDKYDIFLKKNGLTSEDALEEAKKNKLFKDSMDWQYVKHVDEISREDYQKQTPHYADNK